MRMLFPARHVASTLWTLAVVLLPLSACKEANEALETDITGRVTDNRGEPVAGATVRLYTLLGNTHFVKGSDIASAEAYIDREAVLASDNTVSTGTTGGDGRFNLGAVPNAFLAVVTKDGCSASFAGFDEETGILNSDTLLTPDFGNGLNFEIPTFVVACATPPPVGPEGNTSEAPPFEAPPATVTCDATACAGAGGLCQEDTCKIPGCTSDADCAAGQPGAYCMNPGDPVAAACHAPAPTEIVPPAAAMGWTGFRITDVAGGILADASGGSQKISASLLPADGRVRIAAEYAGSAQTAFVQIQTGGPTCVDAPPRTDFIGVPIASGRLATEQGAFLELALSGGYEKLLLSTSDVLGQGERSFAVEIGEPCAPPRHPFTAILTWDAGPGQPADLDLNVWNAAGDIVFVGKKQAAWGRLAQEGKGPGPETFESDDVASGPYTIKVQFFSGRPRAIRGKVRVLRVVGGKLLDDTFGFEVDHPKDVAEIGVFASQ
jgi:hypothetical protein